MMIAGIDEAGKGPVIGPMCIGGGVKIDESKAHILKVLGVADSKKLTPKKGSSLQLRSKNMQTAISFLRSAPLRSMNSGKL